MRIKNTTDYDDRFLRRMVSWCCKQLGLPMRFVREIQFRNRTTATFSGRCYHSRGGCRIVVSVCNEAAAARFFPWSDGGRSSGIKGIVRTLSDRMECLVNLTAHELRHARSEIDGERTRGRGGRIGSSERATEHDAQKVLDAFRANRETLLAEWSQPVVRQPKAQQTAQERREDGARKKLSEWNRKLALAKTKVAKYRKRVRYYERQATLAATKR